MTIEILFGAVGSAVCIIGAMAYLVVIAIAAIKIINSDKL